MPSKGTYPSKPVLPVSSLSVGHSSIANFFPTWGRVPLAQVNAWLSAAQPASRSCWSIIKRVSFSDKSKRRAAARCVISFLYALRSVSVFLASSCSFACNCASSASTLALVCACVSSCLPSKMAIQPPSAVNLFFLASSSASVCALVFNACCSCSFNSVTWCWY